MEKAESDWLVANLLSGTTAPGRELHHHQIGFHSQQAAEKYLKALMQEAGLVVPRTHDLDILVDQLRPVDAAIVGLRRAVKPLTASPSSSATPA